MAERDSAFLWETEAIRSKPRITGKHVARTAEVWLTLREASEDTGIPVETLRKWARRDLIPNYLEDTGEAQLRMVSREGVHRRAGALGRQIDTAPPVPRPRAEPDHPPTDRAPDPEVAPGTMLVPIEAWEKMLIQLGNLHQAGQDLAEARERAAKAETESRFLKERLEELRRQSTPGEVTSDEPDAPASEPSVAEDFKEEADSDEGHPESQPLDLAGYSVALVKHLYGTWRNRPRR